jgi:predicted DsbA family dithiol-disulfide isomerase/uncharacterized membrane protein
VALATSSALYVDYMSFSPSFCGAGSGCQEVRKSGFGYLVLADQVIPVPLLGLLGFGVLLAVSLYREPKVRTWLTLPTATFAGITGVSLFLIQLLKIKRLCALCVVVDTAAVVAMVSAWGIARKPLLEEHLKAWAWALLGVLAFLSPLVWPMARGDAPLPTSVRRYYEPGKINVVEFADFECPHCRRLHSYLGDIIRDYGARVHFVRLNAPMDVHPHARDAARAAICAEAQGQGQVMADHLFQAEALTPKANMEKAKELGLDVKLFDACLRDPKTDARIVLEAKILYDSEFLGLPTTYVGAQRFVGAQPPEIFRDAFEEAARGKTPPRVPGTVYWTVIALAATMVVAVGRERRRAESV